MSKIPAWRTALRPLISRARTKKECQSTTKNHAGQCSGPGDRNGLYGVVEV